MGRDLSVTLHPTCVQAEREGEGAGAGEGAGLAREYSRDREGAKAGRQTRAGRVGDRGRRWLESSAGAGTAWE